MKDSKTNYFIKLITIVAIIFTMLFSTFAPIISLAVEGDQESDEETTTDRINFDVNWGNNQKNITTYAETDCVANFNLDLSGVRTGFNNLKIKVEDASRPRAMLDAKTKNTSNSNVDVNKSNSSTLVFKNRLDAGISTSGGIVVNFQKAADFQAYDKEINFILTGDYVDPVTGETQYVQITKKLTATVNTKDEVTTFNVSADLIDSISSNSGLITKTIHSINTSEWYATGIQAKIPGHISGTNVTYGKYEFTIKRTADRLDDKSLISNETNCHVEVKNLPSYMSYDVERNSDGSIKVIITVGEDKENYTIDDIFDFSASYVINVDWNIVEDTSRDSGESTAYSRVTVEAVGNTKGYTTTSSATGTTMTAGSSRTTDSYSENVGIQYYLGMYIANSTISSSSETVQSWENHVDTNNCILKWKTELLYGDRRQENLKEKLYVYSYRDNEIVNVQYKADDGTTKTFNLENDELKLKTISVYGKDSLWEYVDFYKKGEDEPFFRAEGGNLTYTVPDDEVITDYYAVFSYQYGGIDSEPCWDCTYELDINKLSENLSETEIKNIRYITRYQRAQMGDIDRTGVSSASYVIYTPSPVQRYSYFEMTSSNMDSSVANYGIASNGSISVYMRKNSEGISASSNLRNKNPKFFVVLPKCYDYENIKVTSSGTIAVSNRECTDENEAAWYIDPETGYLVINCVGDWYHGQGYAGVNISFTKTLNTYNVSANNTIKAYMITDNESYICPTERNTRLSKNGETPSVVGVATTKFTMTLDDTVKVRNGIIVDGNEIYPSTETDNQLGIYENPIKVKSGETVEYKTELSANGSTLRNISLICKLPLQNNTSIVPDTYSLNSENSLINLDENIVVKSSGNVLSSNRYTVYYTTEDACSFDSTWTPLVSGDTNLASAKAIKIQLADNYVLGASGYIDVLFNMEMPDTDGIAGQISAVKFNKAAQTDATVLEPAAVYVTRGIPDGEVNIQKVFQGYGTGYAPSGTSLNGIEFQLKNVKTGEILVIDGQTDSEGKFATGSTGKATLTNIPRGKYQVMELTNITGYEATDYVTFEIKNGETRDVTVTNYPVLCELTLHKVWSIYNLETKTSENLTNQQGSVSLTVNRQGDSISFTRTVTTDPKTGEVTLYVPYGTYNVRESAGLTGWIMSGLNQGFDVKQEHVDYAVSNSVGLCGLVIEKTVPNVEGSTDTVRGIKFKIEGSAYADSYIDNDGVTQYLEYSKVITVGEDTEGVTQTITDDEKKVTINLGTVYAGNYTITEIDTPKVEVDGENVNRYIDLVKSVSLTANTTNTVKLDNVWRRGTVKIKKTAEEGVELDKFKFRIHGTSYYGTTVDVTLSCDQNGNARGNILLGEYTIEEVGTDAFDATYTIIKDGEEVESADSMDFKIKDSSIININVDNKTAYGYVKVVKTLEGVDDPSESEGIKFEINGLAPSGANIHEEITIGADGTGTSKAIPAGGEYVLSEIESTVPKNYEIAEDVEIELTKHHTEENPLVVDVENKRGKGNLEISTETNPEGGEVYPIKYKVQEIKINEENGSYVVVENTERNIDGDLIGEAKLIDLPAGSYLVSQVSVPTGWKKDIPQIVDVPIYNTAYANFIIEKDDEIEETEVRVSKTILNPEGRVATDADFTKYKLNKDQSFEVKITNTTTNKEYMVFMDSNEEGILTGAPEGTYTIEEINKPKYTTEAYYLVENGIKTKIEAQNGKYYFEIGNEQDSTNKVAINVENKIDPTYGFGGQDSKDNLSKTDVETVVPEIITRTSLFVTDEEGNFIDGCTFDICDRSGNVIAQISPKTKRGTIKGLTPGQYTMKNSAVPEGYLLADDIDFTVYEDAVRVVRFEIQKNIPRGNLTLQTVYTTDDGRTRNVAKSQYQIVDSSTGELMTFIKKADGSYARSNLPTATDTISLRAGKVTLKGVETGNYEVGLVGLTENFGVSNQTDVEIVDIVENETQDITVQTFKRVIVDMQSAYEEHYILDSCGSLWGWGYNSSSNVVGTGNSSENVYEPRELIHGGVKKMSIGYYSRAVLMEEGNLYMWGYDTNGTLATGSTGTSIASPLSYRLNDKLDGAKVVDVATGYRSTLILDENGKLWYCGDIYYCGMGQTRCNELYYEIGSSYTHAPICLTDMENSPFEGIEIAKMYAGDYTNMCAILDTDGRVWTFSGGNYTDVGFLPISNTNECYEVTCVSLRQGNDIYEAYRNGIKIVDIDQNFAIDELGNLYAWGTNYGFTPIATSLTKEGGMYEGKKFIKAVSNRGAQSSEFRYALIDSENNLYYGSVDVDNTYPMYSDLEFTDVTVCYYGVLVKDKNEDLYAYSNSDCYGVSGSDNNVKAIDKNTGTQLIGFREFQVSLPNYAAYYKYDMKFQKVVSNYYGALALDDDGNLWSWGHGDSYSNYNATGNASGLVTKPRRVEFNEDIKFRDIEAITGYYSMFAIDTKGRLWMWGYSYNYTGGAPITNYNYIARTCISEIQGNPLAEAYAEGTELEEIECLYYSIMCAKDNHNKIWIWGDYTSNITHENPSVPLCISDIDPVKSSIYDQGRYIEKCTYQGSGLLLLDSAGDLWYYYNAELTNLNTKEDSTLRQEMAENGVTIVNIDNCYGTAWILDSEGRVWRSGSFGSETCQSTNTDYVIAEEYSNGNKISYINCSANNSKVMAIDSNGHIWDDISSVSSCKCVADEIEYKYIWYGDSSYYAIDKDGHMWVWGSNSNSRLGIGIAGSITVEEPTITTAGIRNTGLYGKKFVSVNSNGVEDVDGERYRINENNITFVEQTIRYLTNQGIEIKQELDNYVIDTNGKLYYKSSGRWTYPTDVEDSDLYNAYYNDDVKIVEIMYESRNGASRYFFKDSNGHLWNTSYKQITDFELDEIVDITSSGNNTLFRDTDGNYYMNGSNSNGLLANGDLTVTSSDRALKITLDDESQISEILYFDHNVIYVKDQDSRVWAWGYNKWSAIGISDSTLVVSTPYCWGEQFTDVHIEGFSYDDPCYNVTALDVNGHVWTCGYGGSGTWPQALLGKDSATLGMVNNSTQMGTIVKLTVSTDCVYAINDEGKLWAWGNNAYGGVGYATSTWYRYYDSGNSSIHYHTYYPVYYPVCITNTQGVLKDKLIDRVIDIGGYRTYYSETRKYVYLAGQAEALIITQDGEAYKVGKNGVVNSYCRDMFTDSTKPYPEPKLTEIDGNIIDVKYYSGREVYIKTDTGAVYYGYGTCNNGYNYWNGSNSSSFYRLNNEAYNDMTLDEVYADRHKNTSYERAYEVDYENHAIHYHITDSSGVPFNRTIYYPSDIDAVDVYLNASYNTYNGELRSISYEDVYIVDSNGDLWIKGRYTALGNPSNDEYICVTQKEFLSAPIWNTIRNRWNLIYRKY